MCPNSDQNCNRLILEYYSKLSTVAHGFAFCFHLTNNAISRQCRKVLFVLSTIFCVELVLHHTTFTSLVNKPVYRYLNIFTLLEASLQDLHQALWATLVVVFVFFIFVSTTEVWFQLTPILHLIKCVNIRAFPTGINHSANNPL